MNSFFSASKEHKPPVKACVPSLRLHSKTIRDAIPNKGCLKKTSSKKLILPIQSKAIPLNNHDIPQRLNKTQIKTRAATTTSTTADNGSYPKGKSISNRINININKTNESNGNVLKRKLSNDNANVTYNTPNTQQSSTNEQLGAIFTKSSKKTSNTHYSNNTTNIALMTYERHCQLLTQRIYLLQKSTEDLNEEKRDLEKKRTNSLQEGLPNLSEELKLVSEIQSYNNITNNCKINCFELIKEIENLKEELSKYTISPSPPLLHYLSEMITEPYVKMVLRMK